MKLIKLFLLSILILSSILSAKDYTKKPETRVFIDNISFPLQNTRKEHCPFMYHH